MSIDLNPRYPHIRRVKWIGKISRDNLSASARNALGSLMTVFNIDAHLPEIEAFVKGEKAKVIGELPEEETVSLYEEVKAKADEAIADLVSALDPYDFQELVAGVLRAMHFKASSATPGPDQGIDVLAHPDAFGFQQPRIKVQVKHRKGTTGAPEVHSLIGTLRPGDSGLVISTGGFTSAARQASAGAHVPVKLMDRDEFIQLLIDNYEALESRFKGMVPLAKVYVPTKA